jgi:hypothetical protein
MRVLWASNVLDKFTKLLAQGCEYLILILDGFCTSC